MLKDLLIVMGNQLQEMEMVFHFGLVDIQYMEHVLLLQIKYWFISSITILYLHLSFAFQEWHYSSFSWVLKTFILSHTEFLFGHMNYSINQLYGSHLYSLYCRQAYLNSSIEHTLNIKTFCLDHLLNYL